LALARSRVCTQVTSRVEVSVSALGQSCSTLDGGEYAEREEDHDNEDEADDWGARAPRPLANARPVIQVPTAVPKLKSDVAIALAKVGLSPP
jgi:hypothetical protein